jgi:hypothetical protein
MSFEVFICYKTLSGDYYAEKLREALKEKNIKAFVAHKDNPVKTKFSEEWKEFRNKAILDCQTFVLLVTWLFEDSPEIIEEIELARQYGKEVMIFRWKERPLDIVINLGNEHLDL